MEIYREKKEVMVTFACGHQRLYKFFNYGDTFSDMGRRIKECGESLCPDCKRAEINSSAAAAKEARGLSDLYGSPKQVAWANTIREEAFCSLESVSHYYPNRITPEQLNDWKSRMNKITLAKWWIDNRENLPKRVTWMNKDGSWIKDRLTDLLKTT